MIKSAIFHIVIVSYYVHVIKCTVRNANLLRQRDTHCLNSEETVSASSAIACSLVCLGRDACRLVSYSPSLHRCEVSETCTILASEPGWSVYYKQVPEKTCLEDWIYFDNSCYYLDSQLRTMQDAKSYCSSLNAHLLDIKTSEEQTFITDRLLNGVTDVDGVWLGATLGGTLGGTLGYISSEYYWDDDTPFGDQHEFWARGEPSQLGTHCVAAYRATRFLWADVPCSDLLAPLCEYTMSSTDPSASSNLVTEILS